MLDLSSLSLHFSSELKSRASPPESSMAWQVRPRGDLVRGDCEPGRCRARRQCGDGKMGLWV